MIGKKARRAAHFAPLATRQRGFFFCTALHVAARLLLDAALNDDDKKAPFTARAYCRRPSFAFSIAARRQKVPPDGGSPSRGRLSRPPMSLFVETNEEHGS